jgi:tRNA/tmRNA/rRNA uracil-C5-methylase (TrmA/RlmC/RlmD family)
VSESTSAPSSAAGPDTTADLVEGDRVEVVVGAVAHGGHCVGRLDGRVMFIRHALPGERVVAEITGIRRAYLLADAVTVLDPAPDRVAPPCPYARPDRCGGCDLQHVAPPAQLTWKADVVREQLLRLAGLTPAEVADLDVRVEALPGGPLGWRSRVRYAVDAAGRAGLVKHRSHEVVPIDRCLIAHPGIQDLPVLVSSGRRWPDADEVETVASSGGDRAVRGLAHGAVTTAEGATVVREIAVGREWALPAGAFWQVHPSAADVLATAVLDVLTPREGESAWDLYGGAGLFAAAIAGRVGPGARITLVEAAPLSVAAARDNLRDLGQVEVVAARVETALARRRVTGPVDLIVLDPPRAGAGAAVVRSVVAARPRAVAYVACDPAAFARDVRTFAEVGWRLSRLRGYDCFPMTQHVECVGLMLPGPLQS